MHWQYPVSVIDQGSLEDAYRNWRIVSVQAPPNGGDSGYGRSIGAKYDIVVAAIVAGALLCLFLSIRDLPMVDLPQHAAQLAAWMHRADVAYHPERFELNLRTPYLVGYLMARMLAEVFGVVAALKLVAWAAAIGQVIGLRFLCKRLGHDPALALLGLPLALGYNLLFGFISYIVALPFVFVAIAFAHDYSRHTTPATCAKLVAALLAILAAHGIAFAQALLFIGPMLLLGKGRAFSRILPLLVPLACAAVWLAPSTASTRLGGDAWQPSIYRLWALPGLLLGSGACDRLAILAGVLLLTLVLLSVGQFERSASRWIPLATAVLGLLAFPEMYRGYGPLWPRFAILVVPGILVAYQPLGPAHLRYANYRRIGYVGLAAIWTMVFGWRTIQFARETAAFHRMAQQLSVGLRIRPIVFEPECKAFPGLPAINHLPAYYYVSSGGVQGYSFAMYPAAVIRYRSGVTSTMTGGAEWNPSAFRVASEASDYDCFFVHSRSGRRDSLFVNARPAINVEAEEPPWYAYCHADSPRVGTPIDTIRQ